MGRGPTSPLLDANLRRAVDPVSQTGKLRLDEFDPPKGNSQAGLDWAMSGWRATWKGTDGLGLSVCLSIYRSLFLPMSLSQGLGWEAWEEVSS